MNTLIGLFLIAGIAGFIAFIGYLVRKTRAWTDEPEIETEHDYYNRAQYWERRP